MKIDYSKKPATLGRKDSLQTEDNRHDKTKATKKLLGGVQGNFLNSKKL